MEYRITTNILSIMYNLIANLESPYTSYPRFQFSKHIHLFLAELWSLLYVMPLVPLMTQVAETHIDTRI